MMMARSFVGLCVAACLGVGCGSGSTNGSTPSRSSATAPPDAPHAPQQLSSRLPADSMMVASLVLPGGIYAWLDSWVMLERSPENRAALFEELDAYLKERLGIEVRGVSQVQAFADYTGQPDFPVAILLRGATGSLKGAPISAGPGLDVRAVEGRPALAVAMTDEGLWLATRAGLERIASPAAGGGDALAQRFSRYADREAIVLLDVERGRASIPAPQLEGVRNAALTFHKGTLAVELEGDPAALEGLRVAYDGFAALMQKQLESERERALKDGDTLEGLGAIWAHHTSHATLDLVRPELSGTTLRSELSLGSSAASSTAMLGIASAIAIPAMTKYMRRGKTAEARVALAHVTDAALAAFALEHPERQLKRFGAHLCPNDGTAEGETGFTPPLEVNCNLGPGGRCLGTSAPTQPHEYAASAWQHPAWRALGFAQHDAHYFHYNYKWKLKPDSHGACEFTIQARADLDNDGVFSLFERSGSASAAGPDVTAGILIENEVE